MNKRIASRMSAISPSLTLAITAKAKAMKAAGEPVVSFGVGEPDFNTPGHIIDAAKAALDKGYTKYTPSSGLAPLRKAVCDKFLKDNGLSYEPSQIIVSDGAKHSIFNACFAILEEGDEVIIPTPFWTSYPGRRGAYHIALLADLSRSGEGLRRRARIHTVQERGEV